MTSASTTTIEQIQIGQLISRPSPTGASYNSFDVPMFQRLYSWNKTNWSQFWVDLMNQREEKNETWFLGTIITMTTQGSSSESEIRHELIDGQQRVTTLFLLRMAIITTLAQSISKIPTDDAYSSMKEGLEELKKELVEICKPKRINHKNDILSKKAGYNTYYAYLYALEISQATIAGDKLPKNLYSKAYDYFCKELSSSLKLELKGITDQQLLWQKTKEFWFSVNTTISRAVVIWTRVSDLTYAIKIFHTLNSRGRPLGVADLIRVSYLQDVYKRLHPEEDAPIILENVMDFWKGIGVCLNSNDDVDLVTTFLRHESIMHLKTKVTEKQLIDRCKKRFEDINDIASFELQMKQKAVVYGFILDPIDYTILNPPVGLQWLAFSTRRQNNTSKEFIISHILHDINQLNLVQVHLLHLYLFSIVFDSSWSYLTQLDLLHKIVSNMLRFVVRRNLTNLPAPNTLEQEIPQIIARCEGATSQLQKLQVFDSEIQRLLDQSESDFEKELRSISYNGGSAEVRIMLHLLEKWKIDSVGNYSLISNTSMFNAFERQKTQKSVLVWSIEHVLPQSILNEGHTPTSWDTDLTRWGSQWGELSEAVQSDLVHGLGNLTLVQHNSTLGTNSLDAKQKFTKHGNVIGFRAALPSVLNSIKVDAKGYTLANTSQWTENEIRMRQDAMVTQLLELLRSRRD